MGAKRLIISIAILLLISCGKNESRYECLQKNTLGDPLVFFDSQKKDTSFFVIYYAIEGKFYGLDSLESKDCINKYLSKKVLDTRVFERTVRAEFQKIPIEQKKIDSLSSRVENNGNVILPLTYDAEMYNIAQIFYDSGYLIFRDDYTAQFVIRKCD